MKSVRSPPPLVIFFHKIPFLFKGWLPAYFSHILNLIFQVSHISSAFLTPALSLKRRTLQAISYSSWPKSQCMWLKSTHQEKAKWILDFLDPLISQKYCWDPLSTDYILQTVITGIPAWERHCPWLLYCRPESILQQLFNIPPPLIWEEKIKATGPTRPIRPTRPTRLY